MFPGQVVTGRTTFEWLEGERFLTQRSRMDHADFPDSLTVIGEHDGGLSAFYFDSRGVQRVYGMSVSGPTWRMWREAPGFSQRFEATFDESGAAISGLWQLSRDDENWDDDLEIVFRR